MDIVPVFFKFERKSMLPILIVTGMCKIDEFGSESFLIRKALEIIDLSQDKLNGRLIELMGHEDDINIKNGMIAIRFYVLFKNPEEFNQAIKTIQKELG